MSGEEWTASYRGDVQVTAMPAALDLHGGEAAAMAARRRDDILIALEVHAADAEAFIRDAIGPSDADEPGAAVPSMQVSMKIAEAGVPLEVAVMGVGAHRPAPVTAKAVAQALEDWVASRAHKVAHWLVTVTLETEQVGPDVERGAADTGAVRNCERPLTEPPVARREQPVLWGLFAVLLLVGLTLGSFILVSVLAVGD